MVVRVQPKTYNPTLEKKVVEKWSPDSFLKPHIVTIYWPYAHSIAIKWLHAHLVTGSRRLVTKTYYGHLMATKLIYSTLVTMEAFSCPSFFSIFLKRGDHFQNLESGLNMWKSPTIMSKSSSKKILEKKIMGKVYNFFYRLVGQHHYFLFTKMSISTFLTKLCTSILDIVPICGSITLK